MRLFKKSEPESKSEPNQAELYHDMREHEWERFIRICQHYDYVTFKDGRAVGYDKAEVLKAIKPSKSFQFICILGTGILIPFRTLKMTFDV